MVEGARLLSEYTVKSCIVGSNPILSASPQLSSPGRYCRGAANPPSVSHFLRGSAYDVTLRDIERFVHVSWVEFTVEDE